MGGGRLHRPGSITWKACIQCTGKNALFVAAAEAVFLQYFVACVKIGDSLRSGGRMCFDVLLSVIYAGFCCKKAEFL